MNVRSALAARRSKAVRGSAERIVNDKSQLSLNERRQQRKVSSDSSL